MAEMWNMQTINVEEVKREDKNDLERGSLEGDCKPLLHIDVDEEDYSMVTFSGLDRDPLALTPTHDSRLIAEENVKQNGTDIKAEETSLLGIADCGGFKTSQVCGTLYSEDSDSQLQKQCTMQRTVENHHVTYGVRDSNEKPYKRVTCNETFNEERSLTNHCVQHSGKKPYQCAICNKAFQHKSTLIKHYSVHSGMKPYQCSTCNKAFSVKGNLKSHYRVHSGEKPYKCATCNKAFRHKITLTKHSVGHSGVKPYQCPTCNKALCQKDSLIIHCRRHSGVKPYKCAICHKAFYAKSSLKRHSRVHSRVIYLIIECTV